MPNDLLTRAIDSLKPSQPWSDLAAAARQIVEYGRAATHAATWHPYGFLVIRITPSSRSEQVRLHIWPVAGRIRQQPDWPIHNHAWWLTSWILCGRVTNKIYWVRSDSRGSRVLYHVGYDRGSSLLSRTTTRVHSEVVATATYEEGQRYSIEEGKYHQSDVEEGAFAATLVVTGVTVGTPSVVGTLDGDFAHSFERRMCYEANGRELVDEVMDCLRHA